MSCPCSDAVPPGGGFLPKYMVMAQNAHGTLWNCLHLPSLGYYKIFSIPRSTYLVAAETFSQHLRSYGNSIVTLCRDVIPI
jgi:hypothetical protein